MKRRWTDDELLQHFTLHPNELRLSTSTTDHNRLGFAVLLKFFEREGYFPLNSSSIPTQVIGYIASQINNPLHQIRTCRVKASLNSILHAVKQLDRLQQIHLPDDLFASISSKVVDGLRQRAAAGAGGFPFNAGDSRRRAVSRQHALNEGVQTDGREDRKAAESLSHAPDFGHPAAIYVCRQHS